MSWLIKTDNDKFEVWSDKEYSMMKRKCEYYGAKPNWVEVRQLEENTLTSSQLQWDLTSALKGKKSLIRQ